MAFVVHFGFAFHKLSDELALNPLYFPSNREPCQFFRDSVCPSVYTRTFDVPDLKIVKESATQGALET